MSQHGESEKHGPRLYCQPHDGSRTASFLPFKQAFMVGANAHYLNDDDFSIGQSINDIDQGGQAEGAAALPAAGAAGHAAATRKRRKRVTVAFSMIYAHIDNEHLRAMLVALQDEDRKAVDAWMIILQHCDQGTTDLNLQEVERLWANATIETIVGHKLESIMGS